MQSNSNSREIKVELAELKTHLTATVSAEKRRATGGEVQCKDCHNYLARREKCFHGLQVRQGPHNCRKFEQVRTTAEMVDFCRGRASLPGNDGGIFSMLVGHYERRLMVDEKAEFAREQAKKRSPRAPMIECKSCSHMEGWSCSLLGGYFVGEHHCQFYSAARGAEGLSIVLPEDETAPEYRANKEVEPD